MNQPRRTRLRLLSLLVTAVLIAASCSESEEPGASTAPPPPPSQDGTTAPTTEAPDDTGSATTEVADDGSIVAMFAGEPWYLGTIPSSAAAADPSLEPIRIGMLNIENIDGFSFPELRGAAEAAATFVNQELGGVDGHAIEIVPCFTSLSPEDSTACAQQMAQEGVVALVGGIDIMSQGAVPILQQNGLPTLGGIPAQLPEQQSDHHFFFSGGTSGAMAGMLAHAEKNGATSVLIANADLPSFNTVSEDFAGPVAESLGMSVEYVRFGLVNA
ncbi:MAG: ABC transporter substrate-binding protein, partial [Acidimicrobiales bacterium]|nr:ABC transporter substrate-binding protein [Acidimicrobiales bacterium]